MRPLFITRSYPPSVGGMERFSASLASELANIGPTLTIANRWGRRALPAFLPYAVAAAAIAAKKRQVDLVHLGDASLAPLGVTLKKLTGLPVSATVHGLDLTFRNGPYQAMLDRTLGSLDRLIAVSESTRLLCGQRWPQTEGRLKTIPNGVQPPLSLDEPPPVPKELEAILGDRPVLLSVGRLIERKGVHWFVRSALPQLSDEVVFLVAGEGPDRQAVEQAVASLGLGNRVRLLGRVPESTLEALYARADLFVMPNILVANDVEGFGLVALEAAARALPVVAANLQGIPEAIRDGKNGYLVPAGDPQSFAERVQSVLDLDEPARRALGARFRDYALAAFSWRRTAEAYWREFEVIVDGSATTRPLLSSEPRERESTQVV